MNAASEELSEAERKLRADYAARPENSALLTDLYQLNMIRGYLETDMTRTAVFEFFMRRLPERRGFLMAAGLAQVVEYLEALAFKPAELQWLAESGRFDDRMIEYLPGCVSMATSTRCPKARCSSPTNRSFASRRRCRSRSLSRRGSSTCCISKA